MQTRVLVVDDVASIRRSIINALHEIGFTHIDEASDGEMAFAMLQSGVYGLCVSDWNMHPMDGVSLVRAVRLDADLKMLPFIMASSERREDQIALARSAGVDDYIVKPFATDDLRGKIEALLGPLPDAA